MHIGQLLNMLIHDNKPMKCTDLFLRYLYTYYNITHNTDTCFGP